MRWPESCKYCESPKPRSFAALMDLYEHNYMRLKCLCPQIKDITGHFVSQVPDAHDLHLITSEQSRHTGTFRLTYEMADKVLRPNLMLRIYHDARQAEVLNSSQQGLADMGRGMSDAALLYRWKTNRFLYKWLNYCRRQGHGFDYVSPVDSANNRILVDGVPG
jgi:uncharacterized protein YqiB (DUF1249 family)